MERLVSRLAKCCQDRVHLQANSFGLLPAELRCLLQFDDDGYLTAKKLGQSLGLAKSRISKIVDGLIEKGLLERWTDPKDGRYRLLNLSAKGKSKLGQAESRLLGAHAMILARFDPDLRKEVLDNLEMLALAMDRVKRELSCGAFGSPTEPSSSGHGPEGEKGAQHGKR